MELRWSASRSRAVNALCEHDAKTSYTHARAGSRSAVDKRAIVAEPYLAIALAPAKLMVWLAVCSDVLVLFRGVDVDGVDGVAGVDDVAAKRPRGPPRTSRSLAELDASEGSNFERCGSPAVEDGSLAAFGDDGAGRCEVSRPSSQPC